MAAAPGGIGYGESENDEGDGNSLLWLLLGGGRRRKAGGEIFLCFAEKRRRREERWRMREMKQMPILAYDCCS